MNTSHRALFALVSLILFHFLVSSPLSLNRERKLLPPQRLSRRFLVSVNFFSSHESKFSGTDGDQKKGLDTSLRKAPPSYSNPTQNNKTRFPIPDLHAQQNASVSPLDHSKQDSGLVMKDPESHDQSRPAEANLISGSSSAPEMPKPVFQRQEGTGARGRPRNKPRSYTRKPLRPEVPTTIVLALPAFRSDFMNRTARWKNKRKEDKNKAAETQLVSAVPPRENPSGPEVKEGTKSRSCVWRSEPSVPLAPPNDSAEDREKEDQKTFLEAIDALRRVEPKDKGKAKVGTLGSDMVAGSSN